ncbi:MAG TPA: thioredoxin family protein [Phycisphaerae bacterium]|nr:thioredoxin family protein [Phycisphaerae bacterium]
MIKTHRTFVIWAMALAVCVALAGASLAIAGPKTKHMPGAESATATVGELAPDFVLKDTDGKSHRLSDYTKQGKIVVLQWFNPECPFIKLHHEKQPTMADLQKSFKDKGVVILSINSTHSGHANYGKDAEAKKNWKIDWPILIDADGKVGHLYGAKTTPHMFVIDKDGKLRYAGAMDNDPRNEKSATDKKNYVRQALASIIDGEKVETPETKPYGCSVKYKG